MTDLAPEIPRNVIVLKTLLLLLLLMLVLLMLLLVAVAGSRSHHPPAVTENIDMDCRLSRNIITMYFDRAPCMCIVYYRVIQ